MTEIDHIRRCSQYIDILLRTNPAMAGWLEAERNLYRKYPLTGLYSDLLQRAGEAGSFNDLLRIFRSFKQHHFLRIGARDLLRHADLEETTGQLSDLASVALQVGLEVLSTHPEWWIWDEELMVWERMRGKIPLVALGLGKLGGHELNYVSDIDLIFLYSERDEEDPDNFIMLLSRLVHWIFRLIADRFEGDRVFQVDFRLRPQGKDGLLVPSLGGAVDHYLQSGRAWERQMLLKCRPVAGDRSVGNAFIHEVRPFVFRRFLDFQALGELREMRTLILSEALRFRPGAKQFDVKLGIGGIREIEFLVQSMQLIYGGRHPELDEPNTLKCLEKLCTLGFLPGNTVDDLREAYIFLRNVEHYIQLDQNRQTQRLPQSEEARLRLTLAMGFGDDENGFLAALADRCSTVNEHFLNLFQESPVEESEAEGHDAGKSDWLGLFPVETLARLRQTLKKYPATVGVETLSGLESFAEVGDEGLREKVLVRVDSYFARVSRRPGLMKLFGAVKPWLKDFCRGIGSCELVSGLLAHNPALVEGLAIRAGKLSTAAEWESGSSRLLERAGDYGEKLEWIRRLKNERTLQLVLSDLAGEIDFVILEEEQSSLAGFVIRNTLEAVRQELGIRADLPLSVLGMGKLGSREMSYLSDLDLVFVYSARADEPENQIPAEVIRLIQRFMNMLNIPLNEGPGYPVDARLRPTGNYGPLVVTKKSWLDYYTNRADIWEIQALLRMQHVAGAPDLGLWIDERAGEICYRERTPDSVWPRMCHLRERMEKERAAETETEIDLKLGMGGLADIEFLVQGELLLEGHRDVSMRFRSVRSAVRDLLKDLDATADDFALINTAFAALRALDHRLRLYANSTSAKLDEHRFQAMTDLGLWPPRFDGGSIETWQDVLRLRREVRGIFKRFCTEL